MNIKLYRIALPTSQYWHLDEYTKLYDESAIYEEVLGLVREPYFNDPSYATRTIFKEPYFIINQQQLLDISEKAPVKVQQVIIQAIDDIFVKAGEVLAVGGDNIYNNKCEVHMPGNILVTYNQVMLLENCCTDMLQSQLEIGWRIITVCPQNDQRRPDYILGRFNPDLVSGNGAARG